MTPEDKRRKAEPEVVDISNGALFLRIVALEREIQGLRLELRDVGAAARRADLETMRIGTGDGE